MQQTDPESAVTRPSWEWLLDLAPRLDIIIEMVDEHQAPGVPVGSTPDAAGVRTLLGAGGPAAPVVWGRFGGCCPLGGRGGSGLRCRPRSRRGSRSSSPSKPWRR